MKPLKDSGGTTSAAEQARAYGELRGHGLLYQFTGAWPRTPWARELTRHADIETSSVTDDYTRDELWCERVYFTLARLRDAGAPGDVIGLVERYDRPTQVVIATEYPERPGALAQVVSFGPDQGRGVAPAATAALAALAPRHPQPPRTRALSLPQVEALRRPGGRRRTARTPATWCSFRAACCSHTIAASRSSAVLPRLAVSVRHVRAPSIACGSRIADFGGAAAFLAVEAESKPV